MGGSLFQDRLESGEPAAVDLCRAQGGRGVGALVAFTAESPLCQTP